MFRIIYYLSGILIALLNGNRFHTYNQWVQNTRMVRRDSLVVLALLFVTIMLSLFNWYWLPITIVAVSLLNLIVFVGIRVKNRIVRRMIVKK